MRQRGIELAEEEFDLIETIAKTAGKLGLNEVQVRWRLIGWKKSIQNRWFNWQRTVETSAYEHKACPSCGRVNDKERDTCVKCGADLESTTLSFLRKMGLSIPALNSLSSIVGLFIICVYARMLMLTPGEGLMDWSAKTVIKFGASVPVNVIAGEYWRLGTAIFIHIGIWHLGFNLYALSVVGPLVEETFGKARTVFLYMATGILANLARVYLDGGFIPSAGASGALMGLIGTAAGWGQRDGTSVGRNVRDVMFRWSLYTMMFGFFIGADNIAHAAGFAFGFVFGYIMHPDWLRHGGNAGLSTLDKAMGLAGLAAAILSVVICLGPPEAVFRYLGMI